MPRGFSGVRDTSAEIESRRGGSGPGALWFRLKADDETVVRFLEQDDEIFWCMMHEVPVEGRQFGRDVVCLDQQKDGTPCPGCERDLPRKFKGFINLIWLDAPVFKRDNENKLVKDNIGDPIVIGVKAQVAVWGSGIRLFEQLDEVNTNFRGLTSRPFKIKRKGEKLNTKYSISPADVDGGPQDFTKEEKELAAKKYDLNEFVKPKSYDEFLKELGERGRGGGGNGGGGGGNGDGEQKNPPNPFMRNRS